MSKGPQGGKIQFPELLSLAAWFLFPFGHDGYDMCVGFKGCLGEVGRERAMKVLLSGCRLANRLLIDPKSAVYN